MAMIKYSKRHYRARNRLLVKFEKYRYNAVCVGIRNLIYEISIKIKERSTCAPQTVLRKLIAKIYGRDKECPDGNLRTALQSLLTEKEMVTDESLVYYSGLQFNKLRC